MSIRRIRLLLKITVAAGGVLLPQSANAQLPKVYGGAGVLVGRNGFGVDAELAYRNIGVFVRGDGLLSSRSARGAGARIRLFGDRTGSFYLAPMRTWISCRPVAFGESATGCDFPDSHDAAWAALVGVDFGDSRSVWQVFIDAGPIFGVRSDIRRTWSFVGGFRLRLVSSS